MQPQQQDKLKRMITTSLMLSDQEKQEWLDMLIVMNDKQASELETILGSPQEGKPVVSAIPSKPTMPNPPTQTMPLTRPPLSHISNLPAGMSGGQTPRPIPEAPSSMPKPSPVLGTKPNLVQVPKYPLPRPTFRKPTLKQWEVKLKQIVEEKELPKPAEEKALPQHAGVSGISTKKLANAELDKVAPINPDKKLSPALSVPPKPVQKEELVKVVEVKDVALLNLTTMRSMGVEKLVEALKQVVKNTNYYEVLFYLEKSPLYQRYLDTGREALSTAVSTFPELKEGKPLLNKAEFEQFSDLLKSIQIS